ncbi:peptidase T [Treponema sp.]|uniref:peptidase T n=1 Tax=Treponema sp. TaxID=166 RepID=UPI0025F459B7|nr:peptidase T [Treponema sp.]MCR5218903.1 peptidase T [Treponema sp.]
MNTNDLLSLEYTEPLLNRFLKYVKVWTESDEAEADAGKIPSAERERDLADILREELKALGLKDVQTTAECYTYGFLPATSAFADQPSFCLLAHIDTVDEVTGKDVKPIIWKDYDGKDIELPYGISLKSCEDKCLELAACEKDTLITSDGTTLLGADDKAGVAEIMTALEYFYKHPEVEHRAVEVIFSPDEETGHGMDKVPLNLLKSKYAYTVDGGHKGELETECFNAYKSEVTFTGKPKHTGSARPDMVNAVSMVSYFIHNLPQNQMPETTDGYQGFFAPMSVEGDMENARAVLFLRDFTQDGMEKRKALVDKLADATALVFGGKCQVKHTQQYLNMKEGLDKAPFVTENLVKAYKEAGIEPEFTPIRGGTDGSRLTEMGIPCPNIFTGGHNFHSRIEWASLSQMALAATVLINLCRI